MIRVEFELEIECPADEVFDHLTDVERLPEWQSSAVSSHLDGPMEVGACISETRRFLGREAHTELEVTAYERPRRLTLRSLNGPVRIDIDHELEPRGEGTLLTIVAEADPGTLLGLAKPVLARQAARELRKDFTRLKALLEDRSKARGAPAS